MSKKIQIPKTELHELYLKRGLSARKIAAKFKCWNTTIINRLREYGIKVKQPKKPLNPDKEILCELYLKQQLSPYVIAEKFNCDPGTIRRWLILYNFPVRKKRLIKIDKEELMQLYYKERLSLGQIGNRFGFTASGLFGVFKRYGLKLRNYSESSKYHLARLNFSGSAALKAYLIGFRLGDLHVRKERKLVRVGGGTTKIEQVKLFANLFNKYGKVYVGNQDKKGAWHPEVSLNKSFSFLLPKHKKIPVWISSSKCYFLNFLAGYTDAEGNIGCYPRARFKIASYDYAILRKIGKLLKKYFDITPIFFLEKTNRKTHNQDTLSLIINERVWLLKTLDLLRPLLRHQKRRDDLDSAVENITLRLKHYQWKASFTSLRV